MKPPLASIFENVVVFVMARWQPSGGFGFVPTLPASVEDTYHALRILEMVLPLSQAHVRELKKSQELQTFLTRREDKDDWSLKTAYEYLHACGFSGLRPDAAWLTRFLDKLCNGMRSLGDRYYLARIRREFPLVSCADWISILDRGRMYEWRSAEELWMCLYLHEGSPAPFLSAKEGLIRWLQDCQTPDGGFGGIPGTTSFIENSHWCISGLALLGSPPSAP